MHAGKVLTSDSPAAIVAAHGTATLEAGLHRLPGRGDCRYIGAGGTAVCCPGRRRRRQSPTPPRRRNAAFNPTRMLAYSRRETLELRRDPIRATLAIIGSALLLFVLGYGISMDVEKPDLRRARPRRTPRSARLQPSDRGLALFHREGPDHRLRRSRPPHARRRDRLAIELPPGFGRDVSRGPPCPRSAPGSTAANPTRAETLRSYAQAIHASWARAEGPRALWRCGDRRVLSARAALPLQSGRPQRRRHGAWHHSAAANHDPCGARSTRGRAREGARLDRQFLRSHQ